MIEQSTAAPAEQDLTATAAPAADDSSVEDVLVEEVSIDGMCGVY